MFSLSVYVYVGKSILYVVIFGVGQKKKAAARSISLYFCETCQVTTLNGGSHNLRYYVTWLQASSLFIILTILTNNNINH